MLVRLISDCYYDTPIGKLGYIIKELGKRVDPSDVKPGMEDYLFIIRFSNGEEEVVWLKDVEIIQDE
jgi:hypothetical protein